MKRMNEKNVFMLKGVLSGAVLMALLVTVVFGLGTGIAGFQIYGYSLRRRHGVGQMDGRKGVRQQWGRKRANIQR